ncbi:gamma-glutamyl-gamma-aminobutyrate hydrolase family protein [Oceanithermus sp.]
MPLIGITSQTASTGRINVNKVWGVREPYRAALESHGATVVVLPPQSPERMAEVLARLDGLVLPGGADLDPAYYGEQPHPRLGEVDPLRDEQELFAARWAAENGLPTLGVCRGAQVGAVAVGGSLYQDLEAAGFTTISHEQTSKAPALWHHVSALEGRWLKPLFGERFRSNSYHHQAIRDPGPLRVLARADDGVIEAAYLPGHPFYLMIQWHPELLPSHWSLFGLLVEAARSGLAAAAD